MVAPIFGFEPSAVLVSLIYAFWALSSGAALVALIPLPFANAFRSAVLLSACRGKLMDMRPKHALGRLSDWTVPQKWFWHFYALGALWTISLAYILLSNPIYNTLRATKSTVIAVLLVWEGHLVRRLLETLFLMKYPPQARMHGIAYIFAVAYYFVVPLTILDVDIIDRLVQLVLQGGQVVDLKRPLSSHSVVSAVSASFDTFSMLQCLGLGIFLAGSALQFHSHLLLRRLSSKRGTYKIPRGGAFELVSCPHYFAEILVYVGLVGLTEMKNGRVWLMLMWVVANMLLAAGMTHTWYRNHFKSYPKTRKAIIPYVY